jgi:integrase/recombinase XerD
MPQAGRARSGWPARDIAIIATLATCGLRVSELCAATDTTIDNNGDHLLFRLRAGVKGGRQRTVPIPSPTLAHIRHYQAERNHTLPGPATRRLFVRHNGTPLNQQFIDTLLRRCATTANIATPEGAMAHALRHSYGMRLALRGVPLPVIQQLLGHTDPRTTTIYTTAHATDLTNTLFAAGLL